jgi:hypothetical protein
MPKLAKVNSQAQSMVYKNLDRLFVPTSTSAGLTFNGPSNLLPRSCHRWQRLPPIVWQRRIRVGCDAVEEFAWIMHNTIVHQSSTCLF